MVSSTVHGTTTAYSCMGASQDQLLTETVSGGTAYTFTYGRNSSQGVPEIDTQTSAGATSRILSDAAKGQVLGLTDSAGDTAAFLVDGTNNQVAALTDTGTVGFQAASDPYGTGAVTSGGSSSFWMQNPYGFCAGDRTSTSQGGLAKFGQRWYNTATGNWTKRDTLAAPLDPGNANRYGYAGGGPINPMDSTGRDLNFRRVFGGRVRLGPSFALDAFGAGLLGIFCYVETLLPSDFYVTHPEELVATSGGY